METLQPLLPWLLRNENEIQNIFEFFKYKIKEREYKDIHGGRILKGIYPTSVENNARLALPSDIVNYIEKSLTKSEMERNKAGKKRRIYPKRSEIIKIYPVLNSPPKVSEKEVPFKISKTEVGYKEVQPEYENVSIDLDDLNPKLVCTKVWIICFQRF